MGQNKIAKIAHQASRWPKAVSEHPQSADLMFLLAVVLYCDDDPQRSQAFFLRAKTLDPGDPSYMKGFLDVLARGPAVQPPAPRSAIFKTARALKMKRRSFLQAAAEQCAGHSSPAF